MATNQAPFRLLPGRLSRYRRWWLEESGLSREELSELAGGIWSDVSMTDTTATRPAPYRPVTRGRQYRQGRTTKVRRQTRGPSTPRRRA